MTAFRHQHGGGIEPTVTKFDASFPGAISKFWVGDQRNTSRLQQVVAQGGGNYDFIIDDGGHCMDCITQTVRGLLPALKPNGFLFVEDMHTVFSRTYGGSPCGWLAIPWRAD